MSSAYSKNTHVSWKWGQGSATGKVVEVFTEKVTKTIKDTEVTRQADEACPAYFIEQEDGSTVLKSHSELSHS